MNNLVHFLKLFLVIMQKTDLALMVPVAMGNIEIAKLIEC